MILSGPEIKKQVAAGKIIIDPFNEGQLNPNSYNLRLSNKLLTYKLSWEKDFYAHWQGLAIDMAKEPTTNELLIPDDGLILLPGTLYLGATMEYTETHPPFVPTIEGRSGIGRLGLATHVTAGFGDTNFRGTFTLELIVIHPLRVYAGVSVCQIIYTEMRGEAKPYTGSYQGQRDPRPSSIWKEITQMRKE